MNQATTAREGSVKTFQVGFTPGQRIGNGVAMTFFVILYNLALTLFSDGFSAVFQSGFGAILGLACLQIPLLGLLVWWYRDLFTRHLRLSVDRRGQAARLTAEILRGGKVVRTRVWEELRNAVYAPDPENHSRMTLMCYQGNGECRRLFSPYDPDLSSYDLVDTQIMEKVVQAIGPLADTKRPQPLPPDPELEVQPGWDEAAGKPERL